jgi:hypothetical protein
MYLYRKLKPRQQSFGFENRLQLVRERTGDKMRSTRVGPFAFYETLRGSACCHAFVSGKGRQHNVRRWPSVVCYSIREKSSVVGLRLKPSCPGQ